MLEVDMPKITMLFEDSFNSITWPVIRSVSKDVLAICGLDPETPLRILGERGVTSQPGTEFNREDEIRFGSTNQVYCEAEERVREEQLLTGRIRQTNDSFPVILDQSINFSVQPIYLQHDVSFQFKYVAESKAAALKWRDELLLRSAETRTSHQHALEFDLHLNDDILALIVHLHELKESTAGYGESFVDYFNRIRNVEFHSKGTMDGDVEKLVMTMSSRQARVYGHFEGGVPQEQRIDDNVTYEIDFTYTISYQKPMGWYVNYPIVVHQQHIRPDLLDMSPRYTINDLDTYTSDTGFKALDKIRFNSTTDQTPVDGLRYPYYDEWYVERDPYPWSKPIMNWLLSLDPVDPQHILDLNNLPDMEFTELFSSYLKASHKTLTMRGGGAVRFTLFENNNALDPSLVMVTSDLQVKTTKPLNLRSVYHLRMSFITSANEYRGGTLPTLKKHPLAALEIFQTLIPDLDIEWALRNAIRNYELLDQYIEWFYWECENLGLGSNGFKRIKRKLFSETIPRVIINTSDIVANNTRYEIELDVKDRGEYRPTSDAKQDHPTHAVTVGEFELDVDEINKRTGMSPQSSKPKFSMGDVYPDERHYDDEFSIDNSEILFDEDGNVMLDDNDQFSNVPVMNNSIGLRSTQYLSVFVRRKDE